jgi:hypothetical protein
MNPVARFVSKNRSALVLFVIAIVTGCLAVALFPRRSAVSAPRAFTLAVSTPGRVEDLTIDVAEDRRGRTVMHVAFPVELPPPQRQPLSGYIEVGLPSGPHRTLKAPLSYNTAAEAFAAEAKAVIALPEPHVAWTQNQLSVAGELPQVSIFADPTPLAPSIGFSYSIPQLSRYDFTAGPQPQIAQSVGSWSERTQMNPDHSDFEVEETDFAATDHRAEQHDGDYLFLAGALVGLAGGALIGAIQEAITR